MSTAHTTTPTTGLDQPLWSRTAGLEFEDDMREMNAMSNAGNTVWNLVDEDSGATNMGIDWQFKQGDVAKIEIFNDPNVPHAMPHPLHFHGQRFLAVSTNGVENPNLQWKDTVVVRPGERMQLIVDMSNPGDWMFHCHIARHGLDGPVMRMMGEFRVAANEAAPSPR